jgi:hypothetical protein
MSDRNTQCRYRRRTTCLSLCIALLAPVPVIAGPEIAVLEYDETNQPVVRLDRVDPLSDGLRAILAMYSLQNGAGCTGGNSNFSCLLSDALALHGQCSEQHIALVREWFKSGMPQMSGYSETFYRKTAIPEGLELICYRAPAGAGFQRVWDNIRVSLTGNRVRIYAHGEWAASENTGGFGYLTIYKIGRTTVSVVSHKLVPETEKK